MATTIIHFGADLAARIPVLQSAGFMVDVCSSIDSLIERMQQEESDAVVVSERQELNLDSVITAARSYTPTPLILFAREQNLQNEADFDLVIAPFTPPRQWLTNIVELIARSKTLQAESESLRAEASALRSESRAARQQIEKQCERTRELKKNFSPIK